MENFLLYLQNWASHLDFPRVLCGIAVFTILGSIRRLTGKVLRSVLLIVGVLAMIYFLAPGFYAALINGIVNGLHQLGDLLGRVSITVE